VNDAPTELFERDVGHRTTFRVVNLVALKKSMQKRDEDCLLVLSCMTCGEWFWIKRAMQGYVVDVREFENVVPTDIHGVVHRLEVLDPRVVLGAALMSGCNVADGSMCRNAPHTGILALYMALQICQKVTAYGFGFSNLKFNKTHYFKNETVADLESAKKNHGDRDDIHDAHIQLLSTLKLLTLHAH